MPPKTIMTAGQVAAERERNRLLEPWEIDAVERMKSMTQSQIEVLLVLDDVMESSRLAGLTGPGDSIVRDPTQMGYPGWLLDLHREVLEWPVSGEHLRKAALLVGNDPETTVDKVFAAIRHVASPPSPPPGPLRKLLNKIRPSDPKYSFKDIEEQVRGHFKNQFYPGIGEHKLIFIDSYKRSSIGRG